MAPREPTRMQAHVRITVRCFASVRELFAAERFEVDLPDRATVADLRDELTRRAPEIARLPFVVAVNRDFADDAMALADGDEVALIPPISGGNAQATTPPRFECRFVTTGIDPRPLEREVRSDHDGAVVTFAGVTRDHADGQAVTGLAYEAFVEMAVPVVERIFAAAAARFSIGRARVVHRLGAVPVGQTSIVVVVAAAHRGAAFDACRYLMDRIKAEAPVFKRESLTDGAARWVGDLPRRDGERV